MFDVILDWLKRLEDSGLNVTIDCHQTVHLVTLTGAKLMRLLLAQAHRYRFRADARVDVTVYTELLQRVDLSR